MRHGLCLVAVFVCACASQVEKPAAAPVTRATSPFRAGDFVVYEVERAGEPLHVTIRLEVLEASPDRTLIKATSEKNGLPRTMTFALGEKQTALEAMERTAAEAVRAEVRGHFLPVRLRARRGGAQGARRRA
jgi:hypothetical protein